MNRKIVVTVIVLASVIGVQTVLTLWLYNQSIYLQLEHEALSSDYANLQTDYSVLESDYNNLTANYNSLQFDLNNLTLDYNNLVSNYSDLQSDYNNLQSDYNDLVSDYDLLSFEYGLLQEDYDVLQEDYDSYVNAYEELRESVNLRCLHPTEQEKTLITPDDPDVQNLVLSVTGGWSDPSDWNEFWDDYKKLYDWVVDNIEYRNDGFYPILPSYVSGDVQQYREMWQLPSETLDCREGDCEDMAILLASLLYCYNRKEYAVYCIVVTGHMGVCFPVKDDKICILDPAMHYYTSSGFPFYDLSSDDIEDEINYWINTYDLDRVKRVFSATLWKEFTTTEEFINWMINKY